MTSGNKAGNITIRPAVLEDLEQVAGIMLEAFPQSWWNQVEPIEGRPNAISRRNRLAKRLRILICHEGAYAATAVVSSQGKCIGFASWQTTHKCVRGSDKTWQNLLRRDTFRTSVKLQECKLSEIEVDEIWKGIDTEIWDADLVANDLKRTQIVPEPHWYLAPIMVAPSHQGEGIGRLLLEDGLRKADAAQSRVYLEAFSDRTAFYEQFGFKRAAESSAYDVPMIRQPRIVANLGQR